MSLQSITETYLTVTEMGHATDVLCRSLNGLPDWFGMLSNRQEEYSQGHHSRYPELFILPSLQSHVISKNVRLSVLRLGSRCSYCVKAGVDEITQVNIHLVTMKLLYAATRPGFPL